MNSALTGRARSTDRTAVTVRHAAVAALAVTLMSVAAWAADARTLPEVQLGLQPVEVSGTAGTVAPSRLAVLVIDCSNSMKEVDAGNKESRWVRMRRNVQQALETIVPDPGMPPVEVRLVFFATHLNCLPAQRRLLATKADIAALMEAIPPAYPTVRDSTTAYYESVVRTLRQIKEDEVRRTCDWLLIGLYSDGEDHGSAPGFTKELVEKEVEALRGTVPSFIYRAFLIGPQAKDAANKKQYGSAELLSIDDKPPQLPKPKPPYALTLGPAQAVAVKADGVATPGTYRLPVRVSAANAQVLAALRLSAAIDGQSPFKLPQHDVALDAAGAGVLELELPAGGKPEQGASVTLAFKPAAAAGTDTSFQGEPRVNVAFSSSRTLPEDAWGMRYFREVRRGDADVFLVNPGQHTAPLWTFRGPGNAELTAKDVAVSQVFPAAGQWNVEFSCTSDTGERRKKTGEPVRVIDADFTLEPPLVNVAEGADATVAIKPASGTPPETTYSAMFNGQEVPIDGRTIRIPKGMLEGFGRHLLDVQSRYQSKTRANAKAFTWSRQATIAVSPRPRIAIYPDDFVEGRDLGVHMHVFGDLGNAVTLLVDGREVTTEKYVYPPESQGRELPKVVVPWKSITKPTIELEARPAKAGACPPERLSLTARAADVSARLKTPVDGEVVPSGSAHDLVVVPVGNDCDAVGEVEFEIAFEGQGGRLPDTLVTRKAAGWKAVMPASLPTGPIDVLARPIGGNLSPAVFPEHQQFKTAGSFVIGTPELDIVQVTGSGNVRLGTTTVPPGRPLAFQLDGGGIGRVRSVEWTIGPLAGDPELAVAVVCGGRREEARGQSITPKAWGELPVKALATLDDGMQVPISREVTVSGTSPEAAPKLLPSNVFRLGAKTATLRPNITGDFPGARWALVEKGGTAASNAWTSFTPAEQEESIGLPREHFTGRQKDFDVLLEVDRFPGDPNHAPLAYRVPLIIKARALILLWSMFAIALGLIGLLVAWWFDNPPLSWSLVFGFEDRSTSHANRIFGKRVKLAGLGRAKADRTPKVPRHIASNQRLRCPKRLVPCTAWSRYEKRVQVPLWRLAISATRQPGNEWLWEHPYANAVIEITTSSKSLFDAAPRGSLLFGKLPGRNNEGIDHWEPPTRVQLAEGNHSDVWLLRTRKTPTSPARNLWVCLDMKRGGDPWWWLLVAWIAVACGIAYWLATVLNLR